MWSSQPFANTQVDDGLASQRFGIKPSLPQVSKDLSSFFLLFVGRRCHLNGQAFEMGP
jgi:hypothetical protein